MTRQEQDEWLAMKEDALWNWERDRRKTVNKDKDARKESEGRCSSFMAAAAWWEHATGNGSAGQPYDIPDTAKLVQIQPAALLEGEEHGI